MSCAGELQLLAERLVLGIEKPQREAAIRRSISTSHHALFHLLSDKTAQLVPDDRAAIAVLAAAALVALQDGSLMAEDDARIATAVAAILDDVLGVTACPERIDGAASRREPPNPAHQGAPRLIRHEIEAGHLADRRAGL